MAGRKGRVENLKPFTKGDARINRAGRPKDFDTLRKLVQSVGNEIAVDAKGQPIVNPATGAPYTRIELAVRGMMSNPKQLKTLLAYGYGTPPTSVDVTSGGEKLPDGLTDEERRNRMKELAAAIAKEMNEPE